MQGDDVRSGSNAESPEAAGVLHNEGKRRFELMTSAGLAVADYRRDGDTLIIYHTEAPYSVRGSGIGERLVRGTLDEVRRLGLKVVPRCWFVGKVMDRHPQYKDLLASGG